MWKQAGVGERVLVVLVGCAAVLLTINAATAEPKAIVVLSSLHNLDYAEVACSRLRSIADIKDITEVLNNASDYDPEDVKFNKQEFDGIVGMQISEGPARTRAASRRQHHGPVCCEHALWGRGSLHRRLRQI